ncbi:MBL fold metallo-hydrolase [Planococcus salinus]|uniref:MBL fold metallo-hydrolase n=1 Tax=Planococcus salinus TaxID=1848460 RepID=A0A3M8P4K1_9BACL|nr:MBL fold metallo-hydrolase [Planococcus salinus]RNF38552.1 MBL fold metallo-hydrolase [Planococcus salinus]
MERSSSTDRLVPMTTVRSKNTKEVVKGVYCFPIQVVNTYLIGNPGMSNDWVLVDAGMPRSGHKILKAAENLFGPDHRLTAIILTHGHFDHVGGIAQLLEKFNVPVYAHPQELPFLNGEQDYPQADGSVEGGLVAKMSPLFPVESVNISEHLHILPSDGSVPGMPGWRWYHTPGHSPGHVSLFRLRDRVLLAGDAFVTVRQDSVYDVMLQRKKVHGPPVYLTTDWQAAEESVKKLADLRPSIAATGHGKIMRGSELARGLVDLCENFKETAVPDHGKFVSNSGK